MSNSGKLVALKRHFYDLSGDVRLQEESFSGGLTLTLKYHNLIITCLIFLFLLCQAYYRRASANMALGKFKLSLKDYEVVGTIDILSDILAHDKNSELLYLAIILALNFRTLFILFGQISDTLQKQNLEVNLTYKA